MDTVSLSKVVLVLLFVVGLIGLVAFLARMLKLPEKWSGAGSKTRRMEVKEVLYIDARNKAVILRKDDAEHTLLIGPNGSTVIEKGVVQQEGNGCAKAS